MNKISETTLEINLDALAHNFNFLKDKLKNETLFLGVVKAFAYGSDMVVMAKELELLGADYLAVAYAKEGVLLRDAGIQLPILVLHPLPSNFEEIIDRCLEPNIYSRNVFEEFEAIATQKKQKNYPIHIKFNTGLNRLGFTDKDVDWIASQLKQTTAVKIKSIFSHLAASEDIKEKPFTLNQIETFKKVSSQLSDKVGYQPIRHTLNTSGILNFPEAQFEMVRSGIGLHGYSNNNIIDKHLKPIASLKTIVSQIHNLEANQTVGYNRKFVSNEKRITATLPLGHADGIARQYGGGNSYVFINGQKAPIIGNVCMDMIMVDVTGIPCKEGDEVLIFGNTASAEEFADTADSISYEILTAVSQRVKRLIVKT